MKMLIFIGYYVRVIIIKNIERGKLIWFEIKICYFNR